MVRVEVPAAAVGAAARAKVLVPEPGEAMLVGEKVTVTPAGSPLMENVTAELKPLARAVVSVTGTAPPGATVALEELVERVNPGGGRTVRVNAWVLVVPPPTAPMLRL